MQQKKCALSAAASSTVVNMFVRRRADTFSSVKTNQQAPQVAGILAGRMWVDNFGRLALGANS